MLQACLKLRLNLNGCNIQSTSQLSSLTKLLSATDRPKRPQKFKYEFEPLNPKDVIEKNVLVGLRLFCLFTSLFGF